jgi:hypothetical protein
MMRREMTMKKVIEEENLAKERAKVVANTRERIKKPMFILVLFEIYGISVGKVLFERVCSRW